MFPIIFAAIIGRSLKMIARYYAEKGAKLSVSLIHFFANEPDEN